MRINLFVYPSYNRLAQENVPEYKYHLPLNDTVLFSQGPVRLVSSPDDADFFYMGQFGDANGDYLSQPLDEYLNQFPYLRNCPERHIFQKDGDWVGQEQSEWFHYEVPDFFKQCIIITHNWKRSWVAPNVYVYPRESRPLLSLMYRYDEFPNEGLSMSYRSEFDNWDIGYRLTKAADYASTYIDYISKEPLSNVEPHDTRVKEHFDHLKDHPVAICAQGNRFDSTQFFEACFFGRVPILVSEGVLPGEDMYDTSFAYQLTPALPSTIMSIQLDAIAESFTPEVMKARSKAARRYFEHIIRPQMHDPTGEFIYFLQRRNLIKGFRHPR